MSRKHWGVECCAFKRKLVDLIRESHLLSTSPLIIKTQETGEPFSGKLMYIMLTHGGGVVRNEYNCVTIDAEGIL